MQNGKKHERTGMKLAIVTGGSKGLGKSLIETYQKAGFEVREISRSGVSTNTIKADFANPTASAKVIDAALSELADNSYSEIILINNVGTLDPIGPISEFDVESWVSNLNINLTSSLVTSGLFVKRFQKHSCRKIIANISSGAAVKGKHGWSLYCAAKAGLEQFSKTLAIEQNSQENPFRVVIIDPGIIDTGMQAGIRETDEALFPELGRFQEFKNNGSLRTPQSVAKKIVGVLTGNAENGEKYSINEL